MNEYRRGPGAGWRDFKAAVRDVLPWLLAGLVTGLLWRYGAGAADGRHRLLSGGGYSMVHVHIISANVREEHAFHRQHGTEAWISMSAAIAVIKHRDGSVIVFPSGDEWLLVSETPEELMKDEWSRVLDELETER